MNKVVIFDFDGVIADTLHLAHRIMNIANPHVSLERYRQMFEGNIFTVSEKQADMKPFPEEQWDEEYQKYILEQKLMTGMDIAIPQLADKYTMVIVSSAPSVAIHTFLSAHNLHSYFSRIFGSDIAKSKVKKIEMVFEDFNAGPQDCVLVTDTLGDIIEARHAGVEAVAISGGYHSDDTLLKGNPWVLLKYPSQLLAAVDRYFQMEASP